VWRFETADEDSRTLSQSLLLSDGDLNASMIQQGQQPDLQPALGNLVASRRHPRGPIALGNDAALLVAERLVRQIYWNSPRLRRWVQTWASGGKEAAQVAERQAFKQYLQEVGVCSGALVMAHLSASNLRFTDRDQPGNEPPRFLGVAAQLVDDLLKLVGPAGTLVMPTIARYQFENDYQGPTDRAGPQFYDPGSEPSGVGLASELFRRRQGVLRSLHPCNSLAACGPLAAELLHDNLNEHKPLPHGIYSGYYRLCQKDGLVISVGVPLGRYLTLVHVGEEVRDQQWPVRDFFEDREYLVRINGEDQRYVVRQHRYEYGAFCLCMRKFHRDLLAEGILHEGHVGSVRVDWLRAREVFDYLMSRNERSPYPYYWTWLVRRKR
jgi:aminoglycoside 3-N-acetyltransferase